MTQPPRQAVAPARTPKRPARKAPRVKKAGGGIAKPHIGIHPPNKPKGH